MQKYVKKRIVSVVLVVLFLITTFPMSALADVVFNQSAASMSTPRGYYPGAAVIDSNHILVYGGSYPNYNNGLTSAEVYTISSNSFSTTANMSTRRRYNATNSATLSDGTVVAAGGFNGSSVSAISLYKNGSWSNAPVSLKTPRCWHTTTKLQDGRVLIAGGKNGSTYLKSVEIYNPTNNTITYAASMSYYHSAGAATLLNDGRVLVAGGDAGSSGSSRDTLSEIYDPETNTWETISRYPGPGRAGLILVTLDSGIVMLMGGNTGSTGSSGADTSTYYYYPEKSGSSAWESGPSMSGMAKSRAAYAMIGNTVYIFGGGSNSGNFEDTVTTVTINEPKLTEINGLNISPGSLNPSYNKNTLSYTARAADGTYQYPANQSSINVTATAVNGNIYINGSYTSSGSSRSVPLSKGDNVIYVDVKDNDNIVRRYTINAYRKYGSTVTYNYNCTGATGLPTDSDSYEPNEVVTVKSGDTLVRDGYRFKCWSTYSSGGTEYYPDDSSRNKFNMGTSNVTLYAQWTKTYDVTYYGNENTGGMVPAEGNSPYDTGTQVTVLDKGTLDRTGYRFNGWNTIANGSGTAYAAGQKYNIASDMNLYAQWVKTYEVTYYGNDNTSGDAPIDSNTPYDTGAQVTVLGKGTLDRTGYSFDGWNTLADGNGTAYAESQKYNIANDMNLYAQWDMLTYTFEFDSRGGDSVDDQTINHGNEAAEPADPEKIGYNFDGWYTSTAFDTQWNFSTDVTSDTTVYAKWVPSSGTKYTMKYFHQNIEDNDYSAAEVIEESGTTDEEVTIPEKAFVGFEENLTHSDRLITDNIKGDGSLVLARYYARNEYTVTFNRNTQDSVDNMPTEQNVRHAGKATEPSEAPTRTGYTFGGWYEESECTSAWNFENAVTADTILYVKWTPNSDTKYTMKYFQQNIEDDDYTEAEVLEEAGVTDAEVTIPEKAFVGFEENLTHVDRLITDKIKADGTLVLARYYTRNEYSVTFVKNTEEDVTDMPAAQNIRFDDKVIEPESTPVCVNYTFAGWYKEAECTNVWDFDNDVVQADTEIFASWGVNVRNITYDKNQGDTGSAKEMIDAGNVITLNDGSTYTRQGYLIEGWMIENTPYKLGELYTMPDRDIVANAIWAADSDGDGVSDEDEEAAGSDPQDGSDTPQKGTIVVKLLVDDGTGKRVPAEGITCVLNSQPVSVTTDVFGNATFSNVILAQHSLSIRENNTEVGIFKLLFTRGPSNKVTTDPTTGTITTQVAGNFLTLNVTIERNAGGTWGLADVTHTELAPQMLIENPKTGDDSHGIPHYLAWLFGAVMLIGSSIVVLTRKMIKE